jgi:hypothetical protein
MSPALLGGTSNAQLQPKILPLGVLDRSLGFRFGKQLSLPQRLISLLKSSITGKPTSTARNTARVGNDPIPSDDRDRWANGFNWILVEAPQLTVRRLARRLQCARSFTQATAAPHRELSVLSGTPSTSRFIAAGKSIRTGGAK